MPFLKSVGRPPSMPGRHAPVPMQQKAGVLAWTGGEAYGTLTNGRNTPYVTAWDVQRAVKMGMEQTTWVFRAIDAIASNAAGLPFLVRRDNKYKGPPVDDHPLPPFFNTKPNDAPVENAFAFRYRLSSILLLDKHGVFIQVRRSRRGQVIGLYILQPGTCRPIPHPEKFVDHYEVTVGPKKEPLPVEDVIWIKLPHPTDPYLGLTPLEAAGLAVETDILAKQFNRNFLQNDGRPGGILAVKGGMEEEDAEILRNRFLGPSAGGRGPQGAGRLTVLETGDSGVDFVDSSTTPRDAQWTDGRKATKEEIFIAFGVPETIVGNASGRCVDMETEALTQRGWLRGDEITTGDTILSMDPASGRLVWSPIHEIYRAHYDGPMYRLKHKHADFLVTPGHNWAVKPRPGQGYKPHWVPSGMAELKKVEDIGENDTIIAMGDPESSLLESVYSTAFVELVGWCVIEGCFDRLDYIRLCQNEGVFAERIRAVLKESGALWSEWHQKDREHLRRFYLRGEIARAITAVAPDKIMSMEFLCSLTAEQREHLLQTMIDADGARQTSTASWIFTQKSKEAAEAFQALATLAGYRTSLRYETTSKTLKSGETAWRWRVIVSQGKKMSFIPRQGQKRIEPYKGEVWCPRTDFGTFTCRRMGRVVITGNTFDNASVETEIFWRETMLPHLELIARPFDALTGSDDQFAAFDTSEIYVLDRDKREQAKYYLEEFKAGLISVDTYLEKTGQEPVGDDHRYIMNNFAQYEEDGELTVNWYSQTGQPKLPAPPISPEGPQAEGGGGFAPGSPADSQDNPTAPTGRGETPSTSPTPSTRGLPAPMALPTSVEAKGMTWGKWLVDPISMKSRSRTLDARMNSWERHVKRQMRYFFDRQERVVIEKVRSAKIRAAWAINPQDVQVESIFDKQRWDEQLSTDSADWVANIMADFGADVTTRFEYEWEPNKAVQAVHFQTRRICQTNTETLGLLTKVLVAARASKLDVDTMVGYVEKVFIEAREMRAEQIAATEVVSAANTGIFVAAAVSGVEHLTKTWTSLDERHQGLDGTTVEFGAKFASGRHGIDYPGDPTGDPTVTVGCRCVLTVGTDEGPVGIDTIEALTTT